MKWIDWIIPSKYFQNISIKRPCVLIQAVECFEIRIMNLIGSYFSYRSENSMLNNNHDWIENLHSAFDHLFGGAIFVWCNNNIYATEMTKKKLHFINGVMNRCGDFPSKYLDCVMRLTSKYPKTGFHIHMSCVHIVI